MYEVNPHSSVILPPPLFSPHVLPLNEKQKRTYGEIGYVEHSKSIEPYMVDDFESVLSSFEYARQYNYHIVWQRTIEVNIMEARGLSTDSAGRVHDVRCKVEVASQIGRTRVVSEFFDNSRSFVWNEKMRFQVCEPVNIRILAYCKNLILPNEKLGRVTIAPDQLIERSTVTEWYSMDTRGDIKLGITLSPPTAVLFKLDLCRPAITLCDGRDKESDHLPSFLPPLQPSN